MKYRPLLIMLKYMLKRIQSRNNQVAVPQETAVAGLYTLSAEVLNECDPSFQCVLDLDEQIRKKGIKNIALTGAYGAGKTTILNTLTKKNPDDEILCISLANFKVAKASDDDNVPPFKPEEEEEFNRLLEYSIIQQLIYREDQDTLPESRFKRIKNTKPKTIWKIAGGILLFFTCLLIIFTPSFFQSTSIYNSLVVPPLWKLIIDIACGIVVVGLLFCFISNTVRVWANSKLNKITIKDMEVGFNNEETNSILNKHIDEVLYFFEKTDYNVVIIEDLDRFKTPLIFSKLREINALINAYKPIRESGRKVVFIYAIRDDLFVNNTLRTKFFDVIIPVIPIVDPSNAGSKLKTLLSDKAPSDIVQIEDSTFRDLGRFVAEMRLLKAIVNDYMTYRKILSDKLEPANLLAMMAYKNFYPQDFIALSHQKGLLYSVLENKHDFTKKLLDKIDEQIKQLKQEISEIEAQKIQSLKELKDLYLHRFLFHHRDFVCFVDAENKPISDIYDEEQFRQLASGKIKKYRYDPHYGYVQDFQKSFSAIQTEVDSKHTYVQRVELWSKRENGEIGRLTQKIQQLEGEKLELPYKPMADLFVDEIAQDINNYIDNLNENELNTRLLFFVLQSGLIDSNYYNYISFFHEGLLSSSDNEFLMNISSRRNTPFTHPLHNYNVLIDGIPLPSFRHPYILNFSLLNFLCSNSQKYSRQLAYIFEQLKEADDYKIIFVKEFITTNDAAGKFLKLFSQNWDDLWPFIENKLANDIDTLGYLFVKHLSSEEIKNVDKGQRLMLFLKKNFDLFGIWESQIERKKLIGIIHKLDLKFSSIDPTKVSKELFQFISDGSHYAITNDNIKAVLKFHDKIDLLEKIDMAHYSSVLESDIKSLNVYIENNLGLYTDKVLNTIDTSIAEGEPALIRLINNKTISNPAKKKYLENQSDWISNIEHIDTNQWDLAIDSKIISPTWSNVMRYCGKSITDNPSEPLSGGFKEYLADKAVFSKLTNDKIHTQSDNKEVIASLFNEISSDNKLSDECYTSLLKSFDKEILSEDMDLSDFSEPKIRFLINSGLMPYSDHYLEQIKSNFPKLVPAYLIMHKDDYLENASGIYLYFSQYSALLSSETFSSDEKITIVENITMDELNEDTKLATLMCQAISNGPFNIDDEMLKKIIELCDDEKLKTEVVYKYLPTVDYDEDIVYEYLNLLSEDYQKITIKGKKPRISIESHRGLLNALKSKGYLKNVIPHDKYITVITRD